MTLADRLAHAPRGRGHSCTIGILLATWPTEGRTEDRQAIQGAMEDPAWTGTAIAKTLAEEGFLVDARHVQQHRRGDCTTANCPMPRQARLPAATLIDMAQP